MDSSKRLEGNHMKQTDIRPYTRQFFKGNGWCFFLALLQTLANVAANLLISWLMQLITDLIAGTNTRFSLGEIFVLSLITTALIVISYLFAYHAKPRFVARAISQYKDFVFRRLSQKSIGTFSAENTSVYISALSNDAASIESGYLAKFLDIIEVSLMFTAALIMMFRYSPLLTAISIGLSLLPVLAAVAAGDRVAKAEKTVSDLNESYMSTLRDGLEGFSVVKSFRAESQICRLFLERVKLVTEAKKRRNKISTVVQMLSGVACVLAQLGVFLAGAYLALTGKGVTAGTVIMFVQMMNYVLNPVSAIPNYIAQYKSAKALVQKIADALEQNVREEGSVKKSSLDCGIVLKDISFGYEKDKPVLQKLDMTFEAGKRYAVVGASGSGKSTLLNLLMAGHHNYDGSICYDDTELQQLSSESLYGMVSMIQQNVFIFNASIRDNITMFSDFPREEVDRAICLAGLSELIAERGEEYLCGENGIGLSGGEKQRISIARSLLKKSQVLLVDEATAALDAKTAFQVSNAILDLQGITRIVVTHSLDEALLSRYDCILTLKNGSIAESGRFDELMERKGYFYSLYTVSQQD